MFEIPTKNFEASTDIYDNLNTTSVSTLESNHSCTPSDEVMVNACHKVYYASVVDLMPFSYHMMNAIDEMFKRCCRNSAVLCSDVSLSKMTDVNRNSILKSDIVFPVLGNTNTKIMHRYHFSPIYDAPNVYFFTMKQSKESISKNIATACKNLWPLFTICLLLTLISGFVAWSIETRSNDDEFPRAFQVGLFEGFWWAFISMSTVG